MKISLKERYTYKFCKIFFTFRTQSNSCGFSGNREVYKVQFAMLWDHWVCVPVNISTLCGKYQPLCSQQHWQIIVTISSAFIFNFANIESFQWHATVFPAYLLHSRTIKRLNFFSRPLFFPCHPSDYDTFPWFLSSTPQSGSWSLSRLSHTTLHSFLRCTRRAFHSLCGSLSWISGTQTSQSPILLPEMHFLDALSKQKLEGI